MSVRVMAETWKQSSHSGTELLMLLALGDYASDNGTCWPSVNALALKCRVTVRHANRLLAALKRSGELDVQLNAGPHGTNLYAIRQAGAPAAQAARVGAVPMAPKADVMPETTDQKRDVAYSQGIDQLIEAAQDGRQHASAVDEEVMTASWSPEGTSEAASDVEGTEISHRVSDLERIERTESHGDRRNIADHEGSVQDAQDEAEALVNDMMRTRSSEPYVSDFDLEGYDGHDGYV